LIATSHPHFILSTWIFEETLTLVSRRTRPETAYVLGRMFLDSQTIDIVRGDTGLESRAMLLMRSRREPDFSFTDAASWVIAREHAVDAVFAFDRHLRIPGVRLLPEDGGWEVRERPGRYRAGGRPHRPGSSPARDSRHA
jgi:predicted nucleic acid-binding protein